MRQGTFWLAAALAAITLVAAGGGAARGPVLTESQASELERNWQLVLAKRKGPYTRNYCVCRNGERRPVQLPDGRIVSPCGGAAQFCAAWREPWAEALAQQGLYVGNLFARDLFTWDDFPDHHDLVRGYILEKFLVETQPRHKLAVMRAYGGLAGAEYEARAAPRFFERYLDLESFEEPRHYLLAYELQRRFFVRDDQGAIGKARNLASAIHRTRADFKPLRDAVHNQISAAHIPRIEAYRDGLEAGSLRDRCDELIAEIRKLTHLDADALLVQLAELEDVGAREALAPRVPRGDADAVAATAALGELMVAARRRVEAKQGSPADRRRLVDVAITAAAVIQQRGEKRFSGSAALSARQHVEVLLGLVDAAYGAGLLMERERAAATGELRGLLSQGAPTRQTLKRDLARAARVVEWAQATTRYALEEVWLPWSHVVPEIGHIPDDVLRGSPLMLFAATLERLETFAAAGKPVRHELFGETVERGVRALNPGLAVGTLRVAPAPGDYSRDEVLALPETPADLDPAAGILTRGEGNVVSHVQLLARALGIPNAVLGARPYERFRPFDGQRIFYIVTPGGRVVVKAEAELTSADREILGEYTRNRERGGDGALGEGGGKLDIDVERLDLASRDVVDLASLRRGDSGVRVGPKAAFLGELKHLFPGNVARGLVVPFGAYYAHYRETQVSVPAELAAAGLVEAGTPLPEFVEQTY
ncbi:MAG: hypothetical protein JRG84_20775, partial [Deltaproteobacteria bacterium]|nr:hypothetical protein [Deltaproteobacteria bacterium]